MKHHILSILFFIGIIFGVNAQYSFPTDINISEITAGSSMEMPQEWNFEDCVKWALTNNNDIRRTMLSILQAQENIGSAKDAYLPSVGFSTNHSFTNYPSPQSGQSSNSYGSNYNINASWTIWQGNLRKYRLASSKLLKRQQELYGDDVVKNLELGILQAYLNILYNAEAVEIAKQTLDVSSAQADRTKKLMDNGKTSKVDYSQIQSQKAQDEYNLVQAGSAYASSVQAMKNILNLGLDYELKIVEINFPDSMVNAPLPTKTDVFDIAMAWLPQFKSNELNKEIYDYDIRIARSTYYPSISLNGGIAAGYYTGGGNGPGWGTQMKNSFNENIGLSLTIPIYDGNATRRAVSIAKLQAIEYDLTRTDLLNDLSQTIENLYIETENARAKYKAGTTQLEATKISSELVDRQFDLGLVNPIDLLTAHNNLLNARLELLQSKYMAILSNKTIDYYATQQVTLP